MQPAWTSNRWNTISKKVKLDEYFKIYIRVNNEAERNRVISSIDFEKDFLKGIHIIGTDPKPRGKYFAVGYHVFEFRQRIGAKQSQKITFTAKAIKAGDHMGDLDVCVDGDSSCLLDTIRVLVTQ